MISKRLHDAINAQVNAELWSAYLYLAMSLDAENKGYKGVANWFYVQFQEEQAHARIFMNYLNSRDAKVTLLPIDPVPASWDSVLDMFRQTLEHEKKVTSLINNLAFIATDDRDFASINRLNWFIDEQVEEEESAREMIAAVEAVEGNKYGMYMLDKDLAARTYTAPSPLATAAE
ncbi:MAG: ferritin [Bacteroidales bacterium]|jgi:ferritin|nr:ferritin [Bacteroidales bacterium]